jgi:hypothetical protein
MFQIGGRRLLIAYLGKGCVKYVDALSEEGWPRQQTDCREATSDGADGVVTKYRQNCVGVGSPPRLRG